MGGSIVHATAQAGVLLHPYAVNKVMAHGDS